MNFPTEWINEINIHEIHTFFFLSSCCYSFDFLPHITRNTIMWRTKIKLWTAAGSAPRTAPLLLCRPAYEDDKQTEEQRSALPHLYVPTQPAHCAVTKCCCSSCEPIKTLPLLQPINSALHQLPCLFISNMCMDFLVLLPLWVDNICFCSYIFHFVI